MAYAFVSDLHLDGAQPQAIDLFVDFLGAKARSATALYILGDLFESWLGDDLIDAPQQQICTALRALTASGVPVFVMRGNRDFLLDVEFARQTGVQLLPDPVLVHLDGTLTLLTHGDLLCTDDVQYQQLRSLATDPVWRRGLLQLSTATRGALAAIARAGSRKHMARARPDIMDVNPDTVTKVFAASGAELMIHGHTHRPAEHQHPVEGRSCTRIVLDAWYDCGQCLWIELGRIATQRLGDVAARQAGPNESETARRG